VKVTPSTPLNLRRAARPIGSVPRAETHSRIGTRQSTCGLHLLYTRVGYPAPWRKGDRVPEVIADTPQNMLIENAHRYIYTAAPDPSVQQIRPRSVNLEASRSEAEQWAKWGQEQSEAEREPQRRLTR
jgi:hypothetical protein